MQIVPTKRFQKAVAKLGRHQVEAVKQAIKTYQNDRHDPTLRDHALKGKMQGLRTFSAGWDLRVIYREEGGFITIILLDTGTHNQGY
jgi:addiction module RelE/StbE family toxin